MGAIASQITSIAIVYSTFYSGADQRKHQRSAWLAFVRRIHRWPVNSPPKWPVTRKMLPFDDVIMKYPSICVHQNRDSFSSGNYSYMDHIFVWESICIPFGNLIQLDGLKLVWRKKSLRIVFDDLLWTSNLKKKHSEGAKLHRALFEEHEKIRCETI